MLWEELPILQSEEIVFEQEEEEVKLNTAAHGKREGNLYFRVRFESLPGNALNVRDDEKSCRQKNCPNCFVF